MNGDTGPRADRVEILSLRARIVAVEHMAAAALELALRIRPEELTLAIEGARLGLSADYEDAAFAPDIVDPQERSFLAREVERLLRGLQASLGFEGGISTAENG